MYPACIHMFSHLGYYLTSRLELTLMRMALEMKMELLNLPSFVLRLFSSLHLHM